MVNFTFLNKSVNIKTERKHPKGKGMDIQRTAVKIAMIDHREHLAFPFFAFLSGSEVTI